MNIKNNRHKNVEYEAIQHQLLQSYHFYIAIQAIIALKIMHQNIKI